MAWFRCGGGVDVDFVTAGAGDILAGKTGCDKDGNPVPGSIPTKGASDLSASGKTVTVPAGHYPAQVTKDIAAGSATGTGSAQQSAPGISVSDGGLITASVPAKTISVTPAVQAGYVESGTAGNVSLTANSATKQMTTQGAKTVTPSTSEQTAVAKGVFTTGIVKVGAIPNQKSDSGNVTLDGTTTSKSYAAGYYANAHGAQVVLEEKTETPEASAKIVTPTSGKLLSKVTVNGDANLVAANILNGKSIFGVSGNVRKYGIAHGTGNTGSGLQMIEYGATRTCYPVSISTGFTPLIGTAFGAGFDGSTFGCNGEWYIRGGGESGAMSGNEANFPFNSTIVTFPIWTSRTGVIMTVSGYY